MTQTFSEYLQKSGIELSEDTPVSKVAEGVAGYVKEVLGDKADVEAMTAVKAEIKTTFDEIKGLNDRLREQGES